MNLVKEYIRLIQIPKKEVTINNNPKSKITLFNDDFSLIFDNIQLLSVNISRSNPVITMGSIHPESRPRAVRGEIEVRNIDKDYLQMARHKNIQLIILLEIFTEDNPENNRQYRGIITGYMEEPDNDSLIITFLN